MFWNIEENQGKLCWDHSYHFIEFLREEFVAKFMLKGHVAAQLVEAQHYKPEGTGSIPDGVIGIFR
jgi:hypothetical protein